MEVFNQLRRIAGWVLCSCWALLPIRVSGQVELPSDPDRFHLFVLAGQSNMAGRGKITVQDTEENERILTLDQHETWQIARDPLHFNKPKIVGVGPGLEFARRYAAAHPGITVGLIPCAVGGSAIETWQPGGLHPQTNTHPYDDAMRRITHAAAVGRLKGVLWHQGESDSQPARAGRYQAALEELIVRVRTELELPRLPWLIGGLGKFEEKPWSAARHQVDAAHRALPRRMANVHFLSSVGLEHGGDKTHFSSAAARELGHRYYETYAFVEHNANRLELKPTAEYPRYSEGDFVELSNGEVLMACTRFHGASDHASAELVLRRSRDGGTSWTGTDQILLQSDSGLNVMSVSLLRLADGRIALFYLKKNSMTDCRPEVRYSSDEAKTFGDPISIVPNDHVGYYVLNNDRVVQLSSGRIIVPVALHRTPAMDAPDWAGKITAWYSDDAGATWTRSKSLLKHHDASGGRVMVQEPGVVELSGGKLLMWARSDAGFQLQSTSDDSGETWSTFGPMALASPRSPASIERLPTGDLLAVWNDHSVLPIDQRTNRTPLCYAISHDEGQSWSKSVVLESDPDGWYCYTSLQVVGDHLLLGTSAGKNRAQERLGRLVVKRLPIDALYQRVWDGRLQSHRMIWAHARHNAFTDLCRFGGKFYCVFREGHGHVSADGSLRVLCSEDLVRWESAALIESDEGDLRDAKLTETPSGQLMLSGAVAYPESRKARHQSLAWFSPDGETWSSAQPIGPEDFWLWRTVWHQGTAYSVGYRTGDSADRFVSLFSSTDGRTFDALVPRLFDQGYPNETSWLFAAERAYIVLRRDGHDATAQLGTAVAPFGEWTWHDLGMRVGGPQMIQVPDGRIFVAGRLYTSQTADGRTIPDVRTSLMRLNPDTATLTEVLRFPSGGDTSYPGMLWHDGHLWISYYSSHEASAIEENPDCRTAIYLAKVNIGDEPNVRTTQ